MFFPRISSSLRNKSAGLSIFCLSIFCHFDILRSIFCIGYFVRRYFAIRIFCDFDILRSIFYDSSFCFTIFCAEPRSNIQTLRISNVCKVLTEVAGSMFGGTELDVYRRAGANETPEQRSAGGH